MKKIKIFMLLTALMVTTLSSFGAQKYFSDKSKIPPSPIYNKTIMVPKGYVLNVAIKNPINTDEIKVADNYDVVLKNDFIYKGTVIANEGSLVKGKITKIKNNDKNKSINIKFTNIISQNGVNIPVSAIFTEEDKNSCINLNNLDQIFENNESSIIIKQPVTYIPLQ